MSYKEIFSDSDKSESGEDFSVSEDEWQPGKDDVSEEDEDDEILVDGSDSDDDSDDENQSKRSQKTKKIKAKNLKISKAPKLSSGNSSSRRLPSSLRSKLYRKYMPPPKTLQKVTSPSSSKSPVPSKVASILSSSQYAQRKQIPSSSSSSKTLTTAQSSDSESSGDGCLVDPKQIDFSSKFFDVNAAKSTESTEPSFDCNAGMKLSDSSDDEEAASDNDENADGDHDENQTSKATKSIIGKINQQSSDQVRDFSDLQEFARNLESAKKQLERIRQKESKATAPTHDESDITKLLSLGEGSSVALTTNSVKATAVSRKRKKGDHESDGGGSDWENVSDDNENNASSSGIKDIQITVGNNVVRGLSRDQKRAIDVEACLKRRLNRDIKEKQIFLHKVSVLGWIGHGNYVNRCLNNMTLMEMCLKLLPSQNAYPKGDTDIKYYQSFTKWFHTLFTLKSNKLYTELKQLPPKTLSLALQIQSKQIICKRDFVLLFVCLMRAIGVQCRVVVNLVVEPLRPRQKDLFIVSSKSKEEECVKNDQKTKTEGKMRGKSTKESSLAQKIKASVNNLSTSFEKKQSDNVSKNVVTRKDTIKGASKEKFEAAKPKKSNSSKSKEKPSTETISNDKVKVKITKLSDSFIKSKTDETPIKSNRNAKEKQMESLSSKNPKQHSSEMSKAKPNASPIEKPQISKTKPHSHSNQLNETISPAKARPSVSAFKPEETLKSGKNNKSIASSRTIRKATKRLAEAKPETPATPPKVKIVESFNDQGSPQFARKNNNNSALKVTTPASTSAHLFSPRKTRSRTNAQSVNNAASISTKIKAQLKNTKEIESAKSVANKSKAKAEYKLPQLDGATVDVAKSKKTTNDAKKPKQVQQSKAAARDNDYDSNSDSDFEPTPTKRVRPKIALKRPQPRALQKVREQIDRRVFSTDEEDEVLDNTQAMDFWVEAYAEKEKKWIVIDPVKKKVDAIEHIRKLATKPIIYVLAWNNDNSIRDVTPRYCNHWHTITRKCRAEREWLDEALRSFVEKRNPRTIIEDMEFSKLHLDSPLPTSISEFKNHPMYALERHLLKFEAIYPPNALTLGYIRNEPVYARECVHTLHSREIWVKQARTVKVGEKPYKIVKARPKWNRMLNQMEEAKPLEIFGIWQTQPYEPPVAQNGIVPRNAYGNVELFKPEMLPIGTRHIQLPGLNRVCKKMNVDCAQAVIGFDFHSGSSHPTFDGFVVCEEFADAVIEQWDIDQDEIIRKDTEKREARVYGNWKKLIKGLLIRERLKRKFNFGGEKADGGGKKAKK